MRRQLSSPVRESSFKIVVVSGATCMGRPSGVRPASREIQGYLAHKELPPARTLR